MRCTDCKLHQFSMAQVSPIGESADPEIYFIIDTPDEEDMRFNQSLAGSRGRFLDAFLKSLGGVKYRGWSLLRCAPYEGVEYTEDILDSVKSPIGGSLRSSTPDEVEICSKYVKSDILKMNPKVIVPLGTNPSKWLLKEKFTKISRVRGNVYKVKLDGVEFTVVPTYSPSYLIRQESRSNSEEFFGDLKKSIGISRGTYVDPMSNNNYTYALTYKEFKEYYVKHLYGEKELAYDVETNADSVYSVNFDIIGFSLAKRGEGSYVCLEALDYKMPEADRVRCRELLVSILKSTEKLVVHNSNYERPATLYNLGYEIPFGTIDDTLVMAKLMLGGKVGAGLKANAKNIGYSSWDDDVGNYIDLVKTIIKRITLVRFKPLVEGMKNGVSLYEQRIMEYDNEKEAEKFSEIFNYTDELVEIVLEYYEEDELIELFKLISDKILVGITDGIPGSTIPFNWIPYKMISKYGAIDSLATIDLKYHFLDRFDKESTDEVNLHEGYKYALMEHFVGYAMMSAGLKWDDVAARDDKLMYEEILLDSIKFMVQHPVIEDYIVDKVYHNEAFKIIYDYYNDYMKSNFGRYVIASKVDDDGNVIEYKMIVIDGNGKEKKKHIKHLLTDIELNESVERDIRDKVLEMVRGRIYKSTDYLEIKDLFNPASTVAQVFELASKVLITTEFKFAFLIRLIHELTEKDDFDINHIDEEEVNLVRMVETYIKITKDSFPDNWLDKRSRMYELLQKEVTKLLDSNEGRFTSGPLREIVGRVNNYKLEGLDDGTQIYLYETWKITPMDTDDESTWNTTFKWLVKLRWYKKSIKVVSSYIEGVVGRNSVFVVDSEELGTGSNIVKRKEHYRSRPQEDGIVKLDDDESVVVNTNFGIGTAETGRWRCFTGDTKIPLMDGTTREIRDLVGEEGFYVYSYDANKRKIVPGRVNKVFVSGKDAKLVKVTLDNGESFRCTPEHRLMKRNGKYVEAKDVVEGQSLMPLYRSLTKDGYEQVYQVNKDKYERTHHISQEHIYGENWRRDGLVSHHKDFNKLNDDPRNLMRIGLKDHWDYHASLGWSHQWSMPETRKKLTESIRKAVKKRHKEDPNHTKNWHEGRRKWLADPVASKDFRDKCRVNARVMHSKLDKDPEYKKANAERMSEKAKRLWTEDKYSEYREKKAEQSRVLMTEMNRAQKDPNHPDYDKWKEFRERESKQASNLNWDRAILLIRRELLDKGIEITESNYEEVRKKGYVKWNSLISKYGSKEILIEEVEGRLVNHKVVSVEYLEGTEDLVYDMEVDEHHNFAIDSGVIVHNSAFHVLPAGSTVKRMYTSRFKGGTILQPDFSANELRCIASAAQEENMLQAFRDGVDIHRSNAAKIYKVPFEEVTSGQRRFAKTLCLRGNTKVRLLDGTSKTLKELSDDKSGVNYSYTYNKDMDRVMTSKVLDVKPTKKLSQYVKVTFSDGTLIESSVDHPVLLRDGTTKQAGQLIEGDSIMSTYFKLTDKDNNYHLGEGYELFKDLNGEWVPTHRRVRDSFELESLGDNATVVHHSDFNKRNNNPDNLKLVNYAEHLSIHANSSKSIALSCIDEYVTEHTDLSKMIQRYNSDDHNTIQEYVAEILVANYQGKSINKFITDKDKEFLEIVSTFMNDELFLETVQEGLTRSYQAVMEGFYKDNSSHLHKWDQGRRDSQAERMKGIYKYGNRALITRYMKSLIDNGLEVNRENYNKYRPYPMYCRYENLAEHWGHPDQLIQEARALPFIGGDIREVDTSLCSSNGYKTMTNLWNDENFRNQHSIKQRKLMSELNSDDEIKLLQLQGKLARVLSKVKVHIDDPESYSDYESLVSDYRKLSGDTLIGYPIKNTQFHRCFDSLTDGLEFSKTYNHTVKSVEVVNLDHEEQFYDVFVNYNHNFLIDLGNDSGVFVENSFMTLYGGSAYSMANSYFNGDVSKAQEQLDSFFDAFPKLTEWIDARHNEVMTTGKVSVLTHRFLNIDFDPNDPKSVASALRRSGNYPIQSSSSTLVAVVFADIALYMRKNNMKSKPILFIHDSVETDVYPYELIDVIEYQSDRLANGAVDYFNVQCKAEMSLGHSLGHEIEMVDLEVLNEDKTEAIITLDGWKDEIYDTLEDWKKVYKTVEVLDEEYSSVYIPMDQGWIPKRAFDPTLMTDRYNGKCKIHINYYE